MQHTRGSWLWVVVTLLGLGGAIVFGAAVWQQRQITNQYEGPKPQIQVRVLVNGEPVNAGAEALINVTLEDSVTPLVEVDWLGNPAGSVELTWGGRKIEPGNAFRPSGLGVTTLVARVESIRGRFPFPIEEIRTLHVTEEPMLGAAIEVLRVHSDQAASADGETGPIREVSVRLSSDQFDVQTIDLAHVTLWLIDDRHFALGHFNLARASEDEAGQGGFDAVMTSEGWVLRFAAPSDAAPLERAAVAVEVTGTGRRNERLIDFTTTRTPLPAPPTDSLNR